VGEVVQVIYTALQLGASYALIAAGLGLIWGALRFLNLAHGAIFTIGAYAAYSVLEATGAPALLALPVALLAGALAGLVMYGAVFRWLIGRQSGEVSALVAGLGLGLLVQAAVILIYSARERSLPPMIDGEISLPGDVVATVDGVVVIVVSLAAVLLLGAFLERSRLGLSLRAIASDRSSAEAMGINTKRLALLVMAVGGGLAGAAGVLLSSSYFVSATAGFDALVKGLIVTIVGGVGSLRGMLAAALLVGLVEAGVSQWIAVRWSLPILFASLMLFLVFRPSGISGRLSFDTA
jgi:branched-chain amino acid transport system permease protein